MVPDNIRYPKPEEPAWTGYADSRYRIPGGAIELSRTGDGNYWVHIIVTREFALSGDEWAINSGFSEYRWGPKTRSSCGKLRLLIKPRAARE